MYVDLVKHLEDLERALGTDSQAYRSAAQAYRDHPNLRAYLDHIGCIRLCSVDANPKVDTIEITHRTEEGSLEILPFLRDNDGAGAKIYADPPIYVVGYRNPKGFGDVPLMDWEDLMKDSALGIDVIRKVKWYLGAHRPVDYDQIPE